MTERQKELLDELIDEADKKMTILACEAAELHNDAASCKSSLRRMLEALPFCCANDTLMNDLHDGASFSGVIQAHQDGVGDRFFMFECDNGKHETDNVSDTVMYIDKKHQIMVTTKGKVWLLDGVTCVGELIGAKVPPKKIMAMVEQYIGSKNEIIGDELL